MGRKMGSFHAYEGSYSSLDMDVPLTFYPGQKNKIISPCPLELQIHHHPTFYPSASSTFATVRNYVAVTTCVNMSDRDDIAKDRKSVV